MKQFEYVPVTTEEPISTCRTPLLCLLPLIIAAAVLIMLDVVEINSYSYFTDKLYVEPTNDLNKLSNKHYTIRTSGCSIPYFDPFDDKIKRYIAKPDEIVCTDDHPVYIYSEQQRLYFNITELAIQKIKLRDIYCCYTPFYRKNPKENEDDNKIILNDTCIDFQHGTKIKHEFIQVECRTVKQKTVIYKDVFSFVVPEKVIDKLVFKRKSREFLNVLIVGVDAVSRLNLHRTMPKTLIFLKEIMNAKEMLGYNKVADNTYPNLIPVLTGLSENQLNTACLRNKSKSHFDKCPFIWKNYSDTGFITAYGEDCTWMGLFNYLRPGFIQQPTDYDWRSYDRHAENTIGHNKLMNCKLCIGGRLVSRVLMDYISSFAKTFTDHPYFAFFWGVSMSHDYLNSMTLNDDYYLHFFKQLYDEDYLKNTVIVFMSDHGIRWGDIRKTYQGRLEERLPFLFISMPQWFSDEHPSAWANLIRNGDRLTTPFDLHETLVDLLNFNQLTSEQLKARSLDSLNERGISLFLPVPANRTCESAGISDHWCTCQDTNELSVDDREVKNVSNYIVGNINMMLNGYADCAKLTLSEIVSASLSKFNEHLQNNSDAGLTEDYTLVIRTVPGGGLFESTVRRKHEKKTGEVGYSLTGTISRINLYGSQSKCVTDFHMKLYCYCL